MMRVPQALKPSRKVWAGKAFVLWGIIFSGSFFLSPPVISAVPLYKNFQHMEYDVYSGGFHVVEADLDIDYTREGRYRMVFGAHTRGFLDKLVPWKGRFESDGWRFDPAGKIRPQRHKSSAVFRGEKDIKEYKYGKDGSFQEYRLEDDDVQNDGSPKDVDPVLTKNTTDVLAATLNILDRLPKGGKCEGADEIFDGKRRYRLVFKEIRRVTLEATRYNVYAGPAVECTAEIEPMGGAWHKKPRGWLSIQEQGRKKGTMPTIWVANMEEKGPAVPVKVRVKTEYGTLFMHMTAYQNGNKSLKLDR